MFVPVIALLRHGQTNRPWLAGTRPPHRVPPKRRGSRYIERCAGFPFSAKRRAMTAIVDPQGPELCILPTNPAPEGTRVGWFTTSDGVKLRYGTFAKGSAPQRGTVCLVQG